MAQNDNNKQKYPFTLKQLRYVISYPTDFLYSKILPLVKDKRVVILKNRTAIQKFVQSLRN